MSTISEQQEKIINIEESKNSPKNNNLKMNEDERRLAFITEIVEVCKKYKVMLRFDEDEDAIFEEHPPVDSNGYCFAVDLGDLEEAVRLAVWV